MKEYKKSLFIKCSFIYSLIKLSNVENTGRRNTMYIGGVCVFVSRYFEGGQHYFSFFFFAIFCYVED